MKRLSFLIISLLATVSLMAQEATTPPADATYEEWTLTCRNTNPNDDSQYTDERELIKIATAGNDMYIQGLNAFDPTAWVKGTVSNGMLVIPARSAIGSYGATSLYLIGYSGNGAEDVVFGYNAEAGLLSTEQYLLVITAGDVTYEMLSAVIIYREGELIPDDLVFPPDNASQQPYTMTAISMTYDDATGYQTQQVERDVTVAFATNGEVYVKGFSEYMPNGWVKGTLSGTEATFEPGQYMGTLYDMQQEPVASYPFYFAGVIAPDQWTDMLFSFTASDGTFQGLRYIDIGASKTGIATYERYINTVLKRKSAEGITATDSEVVSEQLYDLQGRQLKEPTRGLAVSVRKLANGKEIRRVVNIGR